MTALILLAALFAHFQPESGHEPAGYVGANPLAFEEATDATLVNVSGLRESVVCELAGDDCAANVALKRGFFWHGELDSVKEFSAAANIAADVYQFAGRVTMFKLVAAQNIPPIHPRPVVGLTFGGGRHFMLRDANLNVGGVVDKVDAAGLGDSFKAEAKVHQGGCSLFGGHCFVLCDASFILVNSPVCNTYRHNSAKNSQDNPANRPKSLCGNGMGRRKIA